MLILNPEYLCLQKMATWYHEEYCSTTYSIDVDNDQVL